MSLPKTFQFSATSLQDYVDCPRRFQLRYLLQVAWPAPEVEPVDEQERYGRLARDFHRLIHQHLLGLPVETLSASVRDPDLERWWRAYLAYASTLSSARTLPEIGLSAPLAGYRVVAQYDAIVVSNQSPTEQGETPATEVEQRPLVVIIDWKTYRKRPSRAWLALRLQTRVYPVVLVQAGASLTQGFSLPGGDPQAEGAGYPIQPEDVEMRYWLAEYPETPESFPYDAATYQADLDYLTALITEIAERASSESGAGSATVSPSDEIWPLTTDLRHCRFCSYRSLCERGDVAGPLAEYLGGDFQDHLAADEPDLDFDLNWGQVQEIAY